MPVLDFTTTDYNMQIYAHEVYKAAAFLTMLFSAGFSRNAGFVAQIARNPQRANACIANDCHPVMASLPVGVATVVFV